MNKPVAKKFYLFLASLTVSCFMIPHAGADDSAVGLVTEYLPPKADHTITRASDNESVLVGLGSPLYAGDRIDIEAGGSVTVEYGDSSSETVSGPGTIAVPDVKPLGLAGRIMQSLRGILGEEYREGVTTAVRGSGDCKDDPSDAVPINASALANPLGGPTRIHAGDRNLTLAWIGGCPPYTVEIRRDSHTVFNQHTGKRPVLRIESLAFDPGMYTMAISGTGQPATLYTIEAMQELPAWPDELSQGSGDLLDIAKAAWLANQDDGAWRWEAFQVLRPQIRKGNNMAATLGDVLMWGNTELDTPEGGQ